MTPSKEEPKLSQLTDAESAAAAMGSVIPSESNIKTHYEVQDELLGVMIAVCKAIKDEFKQYLHKLLPKLLLVLRRDNGPINERSTVAALHALTVFGNNVQDFLFLVLPPIMELIQACC